MKMKNSIQMPHFLASWLASQPCIIITISPPLAPPIPNNCNQSPNPNPHNQNGQERRTTKQVRPLALLFFAR